MRLRQLLSLAVFLVLAIPGVGQVKTADPIDAAAYQIGKGMQCQCSCGSTIADCNMLYCHYGEPVRGEIREGLLAGIAPDVIVDQLVAKYGRIILGAPAAEGFGAVGWAMPFVVILLGLIFVPFVIRRWHHNRLAVPSAAIDAETLSRFEAEIERDLASEE